ncbi:hypothetical protein KM043_004452 [Ampulex compressa]|nr:hypothetical protein KM043_004452 [Ampulex compressa]
MDFDGGANVIKDRRRLVMRIDDRPVLSSGSPSASPSSFRLPPVPGSGASGIASPCRSLADGDRAGVVRLPRSPPALEHPGARRRHSDLLVPAATSYPLSSAVHPRRPAWHHFGILGQRRAPAACELDGVRGSGIEEGRELEGQEVSRLLPRVGKRVETVEMTLAVGGEEESKETRKLETSLWPPLRRRRRPPPRRMDRRGAAVNHFPG